MKNFSKNITKNITKNLIILLSFFVIVNSSYAQKKVLVEVFTNSHCGPCGSSYNYMNNNINNKPIKDSFIYVYHHVSTYSDDKLYQESRTFTNPRANWYGNIQGTPTYVVDGKKLNNYTTIESEVNSQLAKSSDVNVMTKVTLVDNQLMLKTEINSMSDKNYLLNVAIVEDVEYKGRNGVATHKNVSRALPTTFSGTNISVSANQIYTSNNELNVEGIWNVDNLSVVTWLQDPMTKEIINVQETNKSEFATKLGIEDNEMNFSVYPNPSIDVLNIDFNNVNNLSETANLIIYNLAGNKLLEEKVSLNNGINNFQINLLNNTNINYNLTNGTYLLVLETKSSKSAKQFNFIK